VEEGKSGPKRCRPGPGRRGRKNLRKEKPGLKRKGVGLLGKDTLLGCGWRKARNQRRIGKDLCHRTCFGGPGQRERKKTGKGGLHGGKTTALESIQEGIDIGNEEGGEAKNRERGESAEEKTHPFFQRKSIDVQKSQQGACNRLFKGKEKGLYPSLRQEAKKKGSSRKRNSKALA